MSTDPRTVESYNKNAEQYNAHVSNPEDSIFHSYYEKPALRAELPDLAGKDVLCIGCGSGVDAQWLVDNGAQNVIGVDISEGLIKVGKRERPNLDLRVMDMEQLDFEDNSFDLACSSLAIHYLKTMTPALKEARRVLKPGGLYVMSSMHPIDSSMEIWEEGNIKGARLDWQKDETTQERTVRGDYMSPDGDGTRAITGYLGDINVTAYHRTFSVMLQQIMDSGFTVERCVEPLPLPELKDVNPSVYEQLVKMPSFIIWVLRKQPEVKIPVVDTQDEVLLARRRLNTKVDPGKWGKAVGGAELVQFQ